MLSIKSECQDRVTPLGERRLRTLLEEYSEHYHLERPHQGLGNRLIDEHSQPSCSTGPVYSPQRVSGILRAYHRSAA